MAAIKIAPHSHGKHERMRAFARLTDAEMRAVGRMSVGEQIATAGNSTPEEAAATLRAAWPDLWATIIGLGRSNGLRPVAMMVHLIQKGMEGE
jgi:hypothetical protein